MDDIREALVLAIHNAEFMCRIEHRCKCAVDCSSCELMKQDCIKGYVANRLIEQFDIRLKDGDTNG